jgi:TRAP-type transport system small permease protein
MRSFHRAVDLVVQVAKWVALAQATAIFVIVLFTVVGRYGFSWVLSWSEEVPRYLMIWMSFLCAAVSVDYSDHIAFDLIYNRARGWVAHALRLIVNGGIFVFGWMMLFYGINFVRDFGPDTMESLPYQNTWYYIVLPISGAMIMLFSLRNQLSAWFGDEGRAPVLKLDAIDESPVT